MKDLTDEIIKAQRLATDEDGFVMVWAGDAETALPEPASQTDKSVPTAQQHTPTESDSQPVEFHQPNAERRQLTVVFCDLGGSTELSGQLTYKDKGRLEQPRRLAPSVFLLARGRQRATYITGCPVSARGLKSAFEMLILSSSCMHRVFGSVL